jgi:hypothetical protein
MKKGVLIILIIGIVLNSFTIQHIIQNYKEEVWIKLN